MTTYNSERFVSEQLESFLRQERLPDELVVSDDASSDNTVGIVRDFATRAPFQVRLFKNDHNLGVAKNFERAIAESTGDLIFLSDADDYWYPQKILLMARGLEQTPDAAFAISNADLVGERLDPLGVTTWKAIHRFSAGRAFSRKLAEGKIYSARIPVRGCCMAFRSRFKELILPMPDGEKFRTLSHDHFIVRTIICSGAGGALLIREPLMAYRRHPMQCTNAQLTPVPKRAAYDSAKLHEPPYLLREVIERIEGQRAAAHCRNASIRSSALYHWRARVNMPPSFRRRLPVVMGEFLSWRYHRFSNGARTAAKDLFFARQPRSTHRQAGQLNETPTKN